MQARLVHCLFVALVASTAVGCGDDPGSGAAAPPVYFDRGYGSIEVGGPFVGFESHHSRPLPSRLSFFSPVANSMDLSTDYWRRDESQILYVGLQIDDGTRRLIGWEPWPYLLSPASVSFSKQYDHTAVRFSFSFCHSLPGMVATMVFRNRDAHPHTYHVYTQWETSLRTCQSYRLKDRAGTWFEPATQTVFAAFDDPETASATVLVGNAGARPLRWSADSDVLTRDGRIAWLDSSDSTAWLEQAEDEPRHRPAAAFLYQEELAPRDSLVVRQFIASTTAEQASMLSRQLASGVREQVEEYESAITDAAQGVPRFRTGRIDLDQTAQWAKAILAANRHFLDGDIVPMPCPAEYNFFFTHDALMTDLAATNFDADRVRQDLLYLARKAGRDNVIPHAYYWRDDGFKTEYAGEDNWNHFWFILVAGSYLRHSGDLGLIEKLQPLLQKSLRFTLGHLGLDGLLWAASPDWWDIGDSPGPRAYMTALAIRALQEFIYLGTALGLPAGELQSYASQAVSLAHNLSEKLWNERLGYLINFNERNKRDDHIYAGSLLAVVFDELPPEQGRELVDTARRRLYDRRIGLRTVDPMDFHLLGEELHFTNNEQGAKGAYLNGGVWPHCTAWYALALRQLGEVDQGLDVLLRNAALAGVVRSPRGQPAMYEYRYSDPATPEYGKVDKPSFLWAGGWYLFTLYRLLGAAETSWNLRLLTELPSQAQTPEFQWLINGGLTTLSYSGVGKYAKSILYDGEPVPSLVIPTDLKPRSIKISRGDISQPYLEQITAGIAEVRWSERSGQLQLRSQAFPWHAVRAQVLSRQAPTRILLDGASLPPASWSVDRESEQRYRTVIQYKQKSTQARLLVTFEN